MSFLRNLFTKPANKLLLGQWYSDLTDEKTHNSIGDVKITFTKDGKLIYEIRETEVLQIINMTYLVNGNTLITDQPSHPKIEKTEFLLIDGKTLVLTFNGEEAVFNK
jgi:hypothetical protein